MSSDKPIYTQGFDLQSGWAAASPQLRQIYELKHKYKDELMKIPGVSTVGVSSRALLVGVTPEAFERVTAIITDKLDGCAVEFVKRGKIVPASVPFDGRIRPMQGATQVGGWGSGNPKVLLGMLCGVAQGKWFGSWTTFAVVPLHVVAKNVLEPHLESRRLYQPGSPTNDKLLGSAKRIEWVDKSDPGPSRMS